MNNFSHSHARELVIGPCIIFISVMSTACTAPPRPAAQITVDKEMQVSVTSDGKPVKNFEAELIHRVVVPKNFGKAFLTATTKSNPPRSPVQVSPQSDNVGKIAGLRIQSSQDPTILSSLGLQIEDVITAVGKQRALKPADFADFLRSIATQQGELSLTLERRGMPHKILYQVGS